MIATALILGAMTLLVFVDDASLAPAPAVV
jgi:hypothetical protein